MSRNAKPSTHLHFASWEEVLSQSSLAAHYQESLAITIRCYLSWAKRARVPVDFDSVRDFITQVESGEETGHPIDWNGGRRPYAGSP